MRILCTALIVVAAAVNLVPVSGVVSAARLEALYGIPFEDANLVILMRHRAVLFGIVGGLLAVAAFHPPLRPAAFVAGLVSMLSFVLIAWLVGDANPELRRVAGVDVVASAVLAAAALLDRRSRGGV